MKINHELAEKIGATHYKDFLLYKVEHGELFVHCNGMWSKSELALGDAILKVKPIQKPRTRTEYEKVTESIFDLRDEFKRGELYCKHEHAREFTQVINTQTLAQALHGGFCFRKVEKEIDWRDEVKSYIESTCSESLRLDGDSFTISHPELDFIYEPGDDEFLELCRVALRANGELD